MIVEGGLRPYAVCAPCARRGGTDLGRAWRTVLGWWLAPLLLLAAALLALGVLFGR